jgi:hypothetical protein
MKPGCIFTCCIYDLCKWTYDRSVWRELNHIRKIWNPGKCTLLTTTAKMTWVFWHLVHKFINNYLFTET